MSRKPRFLGLAHFVRQGRTAFGAFNFITGMAMLAASIFAGGLWDAYGPAATFLAGAGFAALALISLLLPRLGA